MGDATVFCKIVAVAPARVRRDGRVQAQGSPAGHATLGPREDWLEEKAGPGVIDGVAERAVPRGQFVKGERERLLARAFMIRVIVLMTLMPDADVREALIALAGDLALVPWARAWVPASVRALGDWRNALGPEPLEEPQDIVLRASWAEHEDRDWRAVINTAGKPIKIPYSGWGGRPDQRLMVVTPNGKVVEVVNPRPGTVTPILTATNRTGKPIKVGSIPYAIAITPDGRTAYVVNNDSNTVTPISVITGRVGKPISVGSDPVSIAITR